ncbi:MAG: DUF882 domain-containing protein [Deltaproteobacteria bacterium]|nr:MAG: DUF882 domain-containing protein [Deltaproteobacteria bacterium]
MRTAAAVLVGLVATAGSARADRTPAAPKDRYLAAKRAAVPMSRERRARWHAELDARRDRAPAPPITVYNRWTREFLALPADGDADVAQDDLNWFFRCRFTNETTEIDPRLLSLVVDAARHFHARRVDVVSAYRSPKYNLMLQKKGRYVSRRSQHMAGRALDFYIPGVSVRALHRYVRSRKLGGVGFYTHSGYIHADTGRVRYWTAR